MDKLLKDFDAFEEIYAGNFRGTEVVEIEGEPTGDGYFVILLTRDKDGSRIAKVFGTNMATHEIYHGVIEALTGIEEKAKNRKPIGIA